MSHEPELGEIRFDVYRSGVDCSVRVTHVPTGHTVTVGGGTEYECRGIALDALRILLEDSNAAPEGSVVLSPGEAIIDINRDGKS